MFLQMLGRIQGAALREQIRMVRQSAADGAVASGRQSSPESPFSSEEKGEMARLEQRLNYFRLLEEEGHACRAFYALDSQGKWCPKEKLEAARKEMKDREKITNNYIKFMKEYRKKGLDRQGGPA